MGKIKVKINDELSIVLRLCRQTGVYDGALAYESELYVNDTCVGNVSNEGLGGDPVIDGPVPQEPILTKVEKYLRENHSFVYTARDGQKKSFPLDLGYILDAAAYECLIHNKKEIELTDIDGVA